MKTGLALLLAARYFDGNGKSDPVEGIIGLLIFILGIICFDKWVVKKEKPDRNHYKSAKNLVREKSLFKRIWHSFLQMIDFFCGIYFYRGFSPRDEPFRKATKTEKRVGGCFMALWPLVMCFMTVNTDSFDEMIDSMIYRRHSMVWCYLAFIALIGSAAFFAIKIAPKIPLIVSVPVALISWPMLGWVVWKYNLV